MADEERRDGATGQQRGRTRIVATVSNITGRKATITWTNPDDNLFYYYALWTTTPPAATDDWVDAGYPPVVLSRTYNDLTPNTTYNFAVGYLPHLPGTRLGTQTAQISFRTTALQAPGAPSASAIGWTDTVIRVTVSENDHETVDQPTSWEYRTGTTGSWTSVSPPSEHFDITGLTAETVYTVQVRARNAAGASAHVSLSATTQATQGPPPPTNIRAEIIELNEDLTLFWNLIPGATHYEWRRETTGNWTRISSSREYPGEGSTTEPYCRLATIHEVPCEGEVWTFQIRSVAARGAGPIAQFTFEGPFFTLPGAPGPPVIAVTDITSTTATVSFTAGTTGGSPTSYDWRFGDSGDFTNVSAPVSLTGLAQGTTFTIQARARNAGGVSAVTTATFTTVLDPPGTPPTLVLHAVSDVAATAVWTAATTGGPPDRYEYRLGTTGTWTSVDTALTVGLTGLTASTDYTFQLRATNATASSPVIQATFSTDPPPTTTPTEPQVPGEPSITLGDVTQDSADIAWCAGSGSPTSYEYRLGTSAAFTPTSATLHKFTGLAAGQSYEVQVQARNAVGVSGRASIAFQTQVERPGTPTAVAIRSATQTSARATWAAPASGGPVDHYEYRLGGGAWINVGTATAVPLTGLIPNTAYTFQVRAVNDSGASIPGAVAFITPAPATTAPGPPAGLAIQSITRTTASATWRRGSGDAPASYEWRLGTSGAWTSTTRASADLTGLTKNTRYTFQVRAVNAIGTSAHTQRTFTTLPDPPNPPGTPVITAVTGSAATATWTAPTTGDAPAGYEYRLGTTGGFVDAGAALTLRLTGLSASTTYTFQVRSRNAGGTSPTAQAEFTTAADRRPGAPALTISAIAATTATATWAAGAGPAPTGYEYRLGSGANWTATTATTFNLTGLTPETEYTFQVRGTNADGTGPASSRTFTTPAEVVAPPGPPVSVAVASITRNSASGTWSAPTTGGSPTSYQARVFPTARPPDAEVGWQPAAGFVHALNALPAGTQHTFQVRAVNAGGSSSPGASIFTTLAATAPLAAPGQPALAIESITDNSATAAWTQGSGDDPDTYEYRLGTSGAFTSTTLTSFPLAGLDASTAYTFQVRARNAAGVSTTESRRFTTEAAAPVGVRPAAPVLTAAAPGDASAILDWTYGAADTGSITAWEFSWTDSLGATGSGAFSGAVAGTRRGTAGGLTNGVEYRIRVRALNDEGAGPWSNRLPVTPRAPAPPPAPTLAQESLSFDRITVLWTFAATSAPPTRVQYRFGDAGAWLDVPAAPHEGRYTFGRLSALTDYELFLRGVNADGPGPASAGYEFTTTAAASITPQASTPSARAGDTEAHLDWFVVRGTAAADTWEYQRQARGGSPGAWTAAGAAVQATRRQATVTGLTNGTGYRFRVRGTNPAGTGPVSAWSAYVTPRTLTPRQPDEPIPPPPTAPTAVETGTGFIVVSSRETAITPGGAVRWEFQFEPIGNQPARASGTVPGSRGLPAVTLRRTGLVDGTGYRFRFRIVGAFGTSEYSPWSRRINAGAAAAPPAPPAPTVAPGFNAVRLGISHANGDGNAAITGIDYAQAVGASGSFGAWQEVPGGGPNTLTYTVTGLTNGTGYRFRIRFRNRIGTGAGSPSSALVTPRAQVPGQPDAPAVDPSPSAVSVSWTPPVDGGSPITRYDLRQRTDGTTLSGWTAVTAGTARNVGRTGSLFDERRWLVADVGDSGVRAVYRAPVVKAADRLAAPLTPAPRPSIPGQGTRFFRTWWVDAARDLYVDFGASAGSEQQAGGQDLDADSEQNWRFGLRSEKNGQAFGPFELGAPSPRPGPKADPYRTRLTQEQYDGLRASVDDGDRMTFVLYDPRTAGATPEFEFSTLDPATTYEFAVRAVNAVGIGPASDWSRPVQLAEEEQPRGRAVPLGDRALIVYPKWTADWRASFDGDDSDPVNVSVVAPPQSGSKADALTIEVGSIDALGDFIVEDTPDDWLFDSLTWNAHAHTEANANVTLRTPDLARAEEWGGRTAIRVRLERLGIVSTQFMGLIRTAKMDVVEEGFDKKYLVTITATTMMRRANQSFILDEGEFEQTTRAIGAFADFAALPADPAFLTAGRGRLYTATSAVLEATRAVSARAAAGTAAAVDPTTGRVLLWTGSAYAESLPPGGSAQANPPIGTLPPAALPESGGGGGPDALAFDSAGELYAIANTVTGPATFVSRRTAAGLGPWTDARWTTADLQNVEGFAIDADGGVWLLYGQRVASNVVRAGLAYLPPGGYEWQTGFPQLNIDTSEARGIALSADGATLYLARNVSSSDRKITAAPIAGAAVDTISRTLRNGIDGALYGAVKTIAGHAYTRAGEQGPFILVDPRDWPADAVAVRSATDDPLSYLDVVRSAAESFGRSWQLSADGWFRPMLHDLFPADVIDPTSGRWNLRVKGVEIVKGRRRRFQLYDAPTPVFDRAAAAAARRGWESADTWTEPPRVLPSPPADDEAVERRPGYTDGRVIEVSRGPTTYAGEPATLVKFVVYDPGGFGARYNLPPLGDAVIRRIGVVRTTGRNTRIEQSEDLEDTSVRRWVLTRSHLIRDGWINDDQETKETVWSEGRVHTFPDVGAAWRTAQSGWRFQVVVELIDRIRAPKAVEWDGLYPLEIGRTVDLLGRGGRVGRMRVVRRQAKVATAPEGEWRLTWRHWATQASEIEENMDGDEMRRELKRTVEQG